MLIKIYCLKSRKQLAAQIFLDCYQDFRGDRLFSVAFKDVIKVYRRSSDLLNTERTSLWGFRQIHRSQYLTFFCPIAISNVGMFNIQVFMKYSKNPNINGSVCSLETQHIDTDWSNCAKTESLIFKPQITTLTKMMLWNIRRVKLLVYD